MSEYWKMTVSDRSFFKEGQNPMGTACDGQGNLRSWNEWDFQERRIYSDEVPMASWEDVWKRDVRQTAKHLYEKDNI